MKYSEDAIKRVYGNNKHIKSSQDDTKSVYFNLKVAESEKTFDWYKRYTEYIVPADSSTIDDFDELKSNYEIYNDDISSFKKEISEFCDPLGENLEKIDDELQAFPILHNKINVIKGDFLSRNDKYNIILLSQDAIKSKNTKYLEERKNNLSLAVQVELERVQKEMEGMSEEEINQYVEQKQKELAPDNLSVSDFKSDYEIFYEKAIKYGYYDQKVPSKKLESVEDAFVADRFFVYSGWRFGKPMFEMRNTLFTGFQKAPNEPYVHKGDYIWYKKPITISDVLNNYGTQLDDDELTRLGVHKGNTLDSRSSLDPKKQKYVRNTHDDELFRLLDENKGNASKDIGMSQGQGLSGKSTDNFLVWETHIEFKAFRNLIFISYVDDYDNKITLPVNKDFNIPKEAIKESFINKWGYESFKYVWNSFGKEYTAEELWIPWKYEVIRLGEDIYPVYRAVPFQQPDIENPFSSFSLSTFGRILTNRNAKSISSIRRAVPSYLQYLYVKKIMNRELAKYQGFIQDIDADTIPTALGEDVNGELIKDPIAVWLVYRKKLGLNIYSGSQSVNGLPPPSTRSPGSGAHIIGTAGDIFNLQQLLELLGREIGLSMGVPPQREAQFATNSNATDNRQALQQSYQITEPMFHMIDDVWKDAMTDYVNNFRTYCKKLKQESGTNPMFHYILPDGTEELLEVSDTMLDMQNIGLFMDSNVNQQKYNDMMMQYSQAFAQNAGEGVEVISQILKSITEGSSTEETHKLIKIASEKQQQRQEQLQEQQAKFQEQLLAKQDQLEDKKQINELEKIRLKETLSGEYDLKIAGLKAEIDVNNKNIDANLKERELSIKANEKNNI